MRCNKCDMADGVGSNQVIECEKCRELFVAVELDDKDQELIEAAFEWFEWVSELPDVRLCHRSESKLAEAIKNYKESAHES